MPHHPFPTHLFGLQLGRTPAGEWLVRTHDRADCIELGAYGADPLTLRDTIRACRKLPSHWSERSPDRPSDTALSAPAFRPGKSSRFDRSPTRTGTECYRSREPHS